ncbi:RNA polymerase sigma factor [Stieleria varia]|uniref:ECF RNA polymerase sigma factor SigL n=1 Tax=Stieleria varia TaxID=2528005 RepID=A0A5C6A3Z7_9BACT|nr:RNA polymerase sigma factor [Stieleria varia]TWT94624.1 ECF RNA polymerase sigma factor SigL [Stieleria varia]
MDVIQQCPASRNEFMLNPTPRVSQPNTEGVRKRTLEELFDSEEAPLLRYAFSLTGRRAVAEEIVQEVFLQLHRNWDDVDSPRAWLFRSVRNASYNHFRSNKREVLLGKDREIEPKADDGETPDAAMQRMEATGALRQILEELDEGDRQLVRLKYFQGQKYRDISQETGLSIGNVGYRLHHILKELAGKLKTLGFDEKS